MSNGIRAALRAVLVAMLVGCGGGDDDAARQAPSGDAAATSPVPNERAPQQPPGHQRMRELLSEIATRTPHDHFYLGTARARELRGRLERAGALAPWQLHRDAGIATLQTGDERGGITLLESALEALDAGTLAGGAEARNELAFHLGVGYLRLAETANCCAKPSERSCILPIRGAGLHSDREGATQTVRYMLQVVEATEPDSYAHAAALWLLNFAHMTLGTFPNGVPEPYRLPSGAFAAQADGGDWPSFANVAAARGLDTFSLSGGVIVDDFDGDGDLDIVVSSWDTRVALRLFRNDGAGGFVDDSVAAGFEGIFGGLNLVPADYDNDGDLDFVVLRGAWLFEGGRHPNSLMRNHGDGSFSDVTFDAGLGEVQYPTQTAAWADYDNDGDLDLYVGNESSKQLRCPGQLFENRGDGTFVDVAKRAGVENFGFAKGVSFGDYDGDRWPDLYVSNNGQANRLYHNRGDGTFVDVANELGVTGPEFSFPTWFWDYDNDGVLDLYVGCYSTDIGHLAGYYAGRPLPHDLARLYRGDGRGGFTDVARAQNLGYPAMPMGSNFGDVDGDGWLDMYLGTGNVHYYSLMPNLLFVNRRGERFDDRTMASGMGHVQKGHGIAFADLDSDGDLDVFAQMGGAYAGDAARDAVFDNPGFGNRWVGLELRGTRSNRSAIGARIHVVVREGGETRSIHRHVSSGGSFGASPLRQTIGVGRADGIERIEVFWPATGETQVVTDVSLDRNQVIVER